MSDRHLRSVRERLQHHAKRGALRQFEERKARGGKTEFRFVWLLDVPYTLAVDIPRERLTFRNLLPGIPAHSDLDKAVRQFVRQLSAADRPAHRRVDPKRAVLQCSNRGGKMSLTLSVKKNQYAYATNKLLGVVNELLGFLDQYHIQYLWEHFDVPEE